MSEAVRPCLRNLVDGVDSGAVGLLSANVLARYAVRKTGEIKDDEESLEFLTCDLEACGMRSIYKRAPDEPGFHDVHDETCERVDAVKEAYLPQQTDKYGCSAAATAYALAKFGSTLQPRDIDALSGRVEGEFPTSESQIALNLALLQAGYAIECVQPTDCPRMGEHYKESSTLTYDDYVKAMLAIDNSQNSQNYFATVYTKEVYLKDMASRRVQSKLFESYEATGQLKYTYLDATPDYIAQKLETAALQCDILTSNGYEDTIHAVVVENVKTVAGGWCVTEYFNPGYEQPSQIVTRRSEELGHAIMLEHALMFIKPFVATEG